MKILSWDVGVKNLAGCILRHEPTDIPMEKGKIDTKVTTIDYWDIINLIEDTKYMCNGFLTRGKPCKRFATLSGTVNDKTYYYCNTHIKQYEYIKSEAIPITYIDLPSKEKCIYKNKVNGFCNKKSVKKLNKSSNISIVNPDILDLSLEDIPLCKQHINTLDCNWKNSVKLSKMKKSSFINTHIDTIKLNIWRKLDLIPELLEVDHVIIENQPVLRNPRMKTVGETLFNYFLCRGIVDKERTNSKISLVRYMSPCNKLKVNNDNTMNILKNNNQSEKYKLTKSLAVDYCTQIISDYNNEIKDKFNSHKKKDDLADCMLQGLYYLYFTKI